MESGIKGREAIRSGPVPLGSDIEEKNYTGRDPSSGVNDLSNILGAPALGSDKRKMRDHSIGRLVGLRSVESLDSTHVAYTNASLLQKYGREGGLKLHGWLTGFP